MVAVRSVALPLITMAVFSASADGLRGGETNTQGRPIQVLLDESHCFLFATHDGIIRYLRPSEFRLLSSYAALTALPLERFDVICTIVTGLNTPRYRPEEFALLDKVVRGGAGLLIMGGLGAPDSPVNRFARGFGFQFPPGAAKAPFRVSPHACFKGANVAYQVSDEGYPCRVRVNGEATPLVTDATGATIVAMRRHGKGWVAGASLGGLVTHYHGGGKVDVNVELLRRLITWLGQNHVADLTGPPIKVTAAVGTGIGPEKAINIGGFCLRYSAVVEPHCQFLVNNMPRIANEVFRLTGLRHGRRLGVVLLPTGGAGYSSGSAGIAISAFGTPDGQTAVMAHELTNSIHPYGPLWWGDAGWSQLCNQRVVRVLNGKSEKVASAVSPAPDVDPFGWPKAGSTTKLFWMVEQLEQKHGQDFIPRHFRLAKKYLPHWTKRKWPDGNASVVYWWSAAAGEDLFPWVQSMGGTASSVPVLAVVEETSPADGARNVNPECSIVVRLTAPMHTDAPVFDVLGDIQGAIEGNVSVSADGKTLRFQPTGRFAKGERVRVRIHSTGLRDKAGRALDGNGNAMLDPPGEDDYEFRFSAAGVAAYSIEGPARYVEAEDYDLHRRRGTHYWDFRGWQEGVSGKRFLRGEPGWNAVFYERALDRSPSVVFNIQCEKAGRYYLWVRGRGEAGGASLWAIFNDEIATAKSIGFFPGSFTWMSTGINTTTGVKGKRAVFDIPHPGLYSIDFRILEDGVSFDAFVLTDDADFKPGPSTSLQQAQRVSTDCTDNRPPAMAVLQPIQVRVGERVVFDISASDPDEDLLEYSVQNLPKGAAFDRYVRVFSWTPNSSQVGSHRILFSVSDGEHVDSRSAVVEVLKQAVDS